MEMKGGDVVGEFGGKTKSNWTRMVSFLRSKEKAHAQTRNKEELTRKKEPESKFDKIEEEDKPENDDYDEEEYREGHGAIGGTRRWYRGGVG